MSVLSLMNDEEVMAAFAALERSIDKRMAERAQLREHLVGALDVFFDEAALLEMWADEVDATDAPLSIGTKMCERATDLRKRAEAVREELASSEAP